MFGLSPEQLVVAALVIPLVGAVAIFLHYDRPNVREASTLVTAGVLFLVVIDLLRAVLAGARPEVSVLTIQPGLSLVFRVEPLGMLFAAIASGLWIVNSIYSIGYMRGTNETRQTTFYICFAVAIFSALGIAFAGNLITLFLFYEILTLSTYPLVTHKADDKARTGGRIYLMILLGTSMVLLLPAIIWTQFLAGTTDFKLGGILDGKIDGSLVAVLLALFVFGTGKAALMPFHKWLPNAMVAPTPVSALLHAVAVVKAGVFTVLKIVVYIFGVDFLGASGASDWLVYLAGFTIIVASLIAMTKDNLKARLAYSTVSQLSYIILGAALANSLGVLGGGLHIVTHAFGKITLFMCAGAIYVAAHKTEISDMRGLGRTMPFTFAAFGIASLSLIGLPPLGGTWSKWYLALGAADSQYPFLVAVFMISSLLNVAYLLPIFVRGFFTPPDRSTVSGGADGARNKIAEAPILCVLPPVLTALGCIVLFFYSGAIIEFLGPLGDVAKGGKNGG